MNIFDNLAFKEFSLNDMKLDTNNQTIDIKKVYNIFIDCVKTVLKNNKYKIFQSLIKFLPLQTSIIKMTKNRATKDIHVVSYDLNSIIDKPLNKKELLKLMHDMFIDISDIWITKDIDHDRISFGYQANQKDPEDEHGWSYVKGYFNIDVYTGPDHNIGKESIENLIYKTHPSEVCNKLLYKINQQLFSKSEEEFNRAIENLDKHKMHTELLKTCNPVLNRSKHKLISDYVVPIRFTDSPNKIYLYQCTWAKALEHRLPWEEFSRHIEEFYKDLKSETKKLPYMEFCDIDAESANDYQYSNEKVAVYIIRDYHEYRQRSRF
jgi:hypothetical protein